MTSNLQEWLYKRRAKFYQGEALAQRIAEFNAMVDAGAEVLEYPGAVIVLEEVIPQVRRAWLLFDRFTLATVSAMREVSNSFTGFALVAETHDTRIRDLLVKLGYQQVHFDGCDYHLIKLRNRHGM